jgi:protein-L-isoaspartate(D-aspartate) O-methyltransferase
MNPSTARLLMVERHIRARGVRDPHVLDALATIPREAFLPVELAALAYEDRPLPIEADQTISQPYIVALMTEALALKPADKVLEIGTGSGYAAAVLAEIARHVFTIERHAELADLARERLARLGYSNVDVRCGDGTLGWTEYAPFDAIMVAAGGPDVPSTLLDQLAIGGRLVMPVGSGSAQELVRVMRVSETEYRREELGAVQFVPLIGAEGWAEPAEAPRARRGVGPRREPGPLLAPSPASRPPLVAELIEECAEPIARIDDAPLDALLARIGDACRPPRWFRASPWTRAAICTPRESSTFASDVRVEDVAFAVT